MSNIQYHNLLNNAPIEIEICFSVSYNMEHYNIRINNIMLCEKHF